MYRKHTLPVRHERDITESGYCIADEDTWEYFTEHHTDVCFEKTNGSDKYVLLTYNTRDYRKKSAPRQDMNTWIVVIGKHKGRIYAKKR